MPPTTPLSPRVVASVRPDSLPLAFAPDRRDLAKSAPPAVALRAWRPGLRAAAAGDNVIQIYGVIGDDRPGQCLNAPAITAALAAVGDRDVEVHINSPGGDCFEGISIFNILQAHPKKVTVKVMGLAASAASVIAMAGDEVLVGLGSFVMIHNCWVVAIGNKQDLAAAIVFLEGTDASLRDIYVSRSGQKPDDVTKWMDDERFLSAAECVALGFANGNLDDGAVVEDAAFAAAALATTTLITDARPAPQLGTPRDLEKLLRGAGLATAAARKVAAGGWPALSATNTSTSTSDETATAAAALADRINAATAALRKLAS